MNKEMTLDELRALPISVDLDELRALPISVDLVTAGRAFGLGRTVSHELARTGQFPCRVLRCGTRYRVPRSEICRVLGIDAEPDQVAGAGRSGDAV